jgi:hypothetical protein
MKSHSLDGDGLSTRTKKGKGAFTIKKSRLQRLAEIAQDEPDELREQIRGDMLNQIFGVETLQLVECFKSPFHTKEQAEIVAERFNASGRGKAGYVPARVVSVGKRFAVKFEQNLPIGLPPGKPESLSPLF